MLFTLSHHPQAWYSILVNSVQWARLLLRRYGNVVVERMAAAPQVFGVYELTEAILMHLPLYDLLISISVCRSFRQVTMTSTVLRGRLRKEPVPVFARLRAGDQRSEDLCNVNEITSWIFRTTVDDGFVLIFKTADAEIQLHVPHDPIIPICVLDCRRMKVQLTVSCS